jgi:replicative superfamily II helicase
LGPNALIPVPQLGPRQIRLASVEGITPAAADLQGLSHYGFSDQTIEAVRAKLVGSQGLNDLQQRAIAPAGLLAGRDVLVRAPTSAGKTLIGELAFLRAFGHGLKSVVLVPSRALASEHTGTFAESYRGLGLRVIRSAGDASDDDDLLLRGHFDVAVLTYEKFANLVYRDVALVDSIALTVLDEIQLIRDAERGRVTELLLALLQQRRRRGLAMQLVGLCGDFADLGGLPEWLGAELVGEVTRPVPLRECVIDPQGHMTSTWRDDRGVQEVRFALPALGVRGSASQGLHRLREAVADALILELTAEEKQVLVFRTSRRAARRMARRLTGVLGTEKHANLVGDFDQASQGHEQSRITMVLRACLGHGLAFHSSELEDHERAFLEKAFRARRIEVMVATTTLAAGVNLPAHAAVIVDHAFYRGPSRPQEPLDPVDYRNMVGRAGRAGQGMAAGDAYLIAGSGPERAALSQRYLGAGGTRLVAGIGNLAAEDRTMAAAAIVRRGSLLDFVEVLSNTFWGYQQRPDPAWREQLRQQTDDALEHLTALGLLSRVDGREYTLTPAGAACAIYGVSVRSAARVLDTIDRMIEDHELVGADELLVLVQLTAELNASYIPVAEGETVDEWLPRLGSWGRNRPVLMQALQRELDGGAEPAVLVRRIKRAALLRSWLSGRSVGEVENAGSAAPEEPVLGYVRDVARRSGDILPAIAALVTSRQPERQSEIQSLAGKLRTALEFGVTMAAATLQRLRLGFTRKQTLALAEDGITTLERLQEVVEREPDRLERLLTTPGLNDLRATLANRMLARRRRLPLEAGDDTLSLFPDGPLS